MKKEITEKKKPSKKRRSRKRTSNIKKVLILLLITFAFLGILYGLSVHYFSSHFFFGTVINGMPCERMTVADVKEKMQDFISQYSLTIITRENNTEVISAEELGMVYADDHGIDRLMEAQDPYRWFLSNASSSEVAADMTYDDSLVASIVDSLACMQEANIVHPTNAEIREENEEFILISETMGNAPIRELMISSIIEAVNSGKTELRLEEADVYEKPTIYATDETLNAQLLALNQLTTARITYDMGDNRIYTIDRNVLKEWLTQTEDGTYIIDESQAAGFVRQMAYDTDTFGLAHQFKTSYGKTITLAKGGDYGWVIHKDKTTAALMEAINTQYQGELKPVYLYSAVSRGINDIGGTYVEICIEDQTMWCYKDGELVVKTSVVTGNHSTGYDTPSGSVWAIDAKKKDVAFTLYDVDVTFWLPFNDQVGIHDASWRSPEEYTSSMYLTNGSHGCINTPYSAAEKIFNVMNIGYPVVVYYSVDQPVGPQPTQQTSVG